MSATRHIPLSPLDRRRQEITAQLRSARAALSPAASIEAAGGSADEIDAATVAVTASRVARSGFQPRSMTMKLIMERPDVSLRILVAIITLLFGARLSRHFSSIATMVRALRQTLELVSGKPGLQ